MTQDLGTGAAADPPGTVTVIPLAGIPEVRTGHDLALVLREALDRAALTLREADVLVVSSKVVSKVLGLRADSSPDQASGRSEDLVREHSTRVVAERETTSGTTRIVASRAGPVLAAAGVDASNVGPTGGALVLPGDPDLAARHLYAGLLTAYAPTALPRIAVLISDTAGRPWREGQVDFALGACGLDVLDDLRGMPDADGRMLSVTARAVADEVAAAADLVKGKGSAVPAALVRGLRGAVRSPTTAGAHALLRPVTSDWFTLGTTESVRAALGAPPGSAAASAVGLASVGPEEVGVRLHRAIRLGLLGTDAWAREADVRIGDGVLGVAIEDPFRCGQVVARLQVALHSEDLAHWRVERVTRSAGGSEPTSGEHGAEDRAG